MVFDYIQKKLITLSRSYLKYKKIRFYKFIFFKAIDCEFKGTYFFLIFSAQEYLKLDIWESQDLIISLVPKNAHSLMPFDARKVIPKNVSVHS